MIKEYYRPQNLSEAVGLLEKIGQAIPVGGGTSLKQIMDDIVVVDLQDLNLSYIIKEGKEFVIGSMTTLEQLKKYFLGNESLQKALKIEGTKNQRSQSSLGGFLKLADGRSSLLTCFLTLGCMVFYVEEEKGIPLNEFLVDRKNKKKLITHISINDPNELAFETVSRSPLDLPVICCAVSHFENILSAAIGGFGEAPQLVPEKINEMKNKDLSKYLRFSTDEWASAAYRARIAQVLLGRLTNLRKKGNL